MNRSDDEGVNIKDKLALIANDAKNEARTPVEMKRLNSALETVYQRLSKGDYTRFSYTENVFDVPNKTSDFFTDLEFYCLLGKTWATILHELDLTETTTVADLCPGYTPKIELGLFYEKFAGKVDIVDSDNNAMNQLTSFMELFKPDFALQKKNVNLFTDKVGEYDIVCGNHIIDDLLLFLYCENKGIGLGELYARESEMVNAWQTILKNKEEYTQKLVTQLTEAINNLVKKGGYVCLSQYPSYMERMLGLPEVSKLNKQILDSVVASIAKSDFTVKQELIESALNTANGHFGSDDCYLLQRQT